MSQSLPNNYLNGLKRALTIILFATIAVSAGSCGLISGRGSTVEVRKPRLHKTWPKKHAWHKKLQVWKFKIQMPERGGVKKVRMKT
jgi:hypothetical protein